MNKPTPTDAGTPKAVPVGQAYTDATQSAGFGDHYKHVQYDDYAFTVTTPPAFGLKQTDMLTDRIAKALNLLEAHEVMADLLPIALQEIRDLKGCAFTGSRLGHDVDPRLKKANLVCERIETALIQLAKLKAELNL